MGSVSPLHNCLNKTESADFVSLKVPLLQENLDTDLILFSLQLVLFRVAAVTRLPVRHHNADYIAWSFEIIWHF